ncbi:MAG: hypothetical protein JSR99_15245 [Proteobacteria bacterium]|nr:hypothetical protein [Pseudomonadota bacterium]
MNPEPPIKNAEWTDDDTEALFATVGKYLIFFQWIEGKIDQILLMAWGHQNWSQSQARLARMKNHEKINAVDELVQNSNVFARARTRPDWISSFRLLIEHLHAERDRRNSLIHSQYLFEFAEAGFPPVASHRRKVNGTAEFRQQDLTPAAQKDLLANLAQLAMDVNFAHVQLIADYRHDADETP